VYVIGWLITYIIPCGIATLIWNAGAHDLAFMVLVVLTVIFLAWFGKRTSR